MLDENVGYSLIREGSIGCDKETFIAGVRCTLKRNRMVSYE